MKQRRALWIGLVVTATLVPLAALGIDGQIKLGDVDFAHEFHYSDLEIECETCHHETDAAKLEVPHLQYFQETWSKCQSCHGNSATPTTTQHCANCHHDSPVDVADETLSAKVVIHRSCWTCHDVGTGQSASRACNSCHTSGVSLLTNATGALPESVDRLDGDEP